MATHRIPIINWSCAPDTSGTVFFEPSSATFGVNNRYPGFIVAFTSQSAKQGFAGKFVVPKDFVSAPKVIPVWATTATSGDVVWNFAYTSVNGDSANSIDPAADAEAVSTTDTASGTARQRQEATAIALTAANFNVDGEVLFNFYRDGAAVGDTLAATSWLFSLLFEYSDV